MRTLIDFSLLIIDEDILLLADKPSLTHRDVKSDPDTRIPSEMT